MPHHQEIFANCCKFNTLNLFVSVFFLLSLSLSLSGRRVSHARNIQKNNLLENISLFFFNKKNVPL
ncbi:MAG: hypothetical protein LBN27_09960, partial [Prevotellaceae bacterium]|nr:hypothetical protein [Prevotellaceae bacterium]